jgi:hypothetical protein
VVTWAGSGAKGLSSPDPPGGLSEAVSPTLGEIVHLFSNHPSALKSVTLGAPVAGQ